MAVATTGAVPSSISVGVVPESLRFLMDTFGIQGIIGLDVLAMHLFDLDVADGVLSPEIALWIPSAPAVDVDVDTRGAERRTRPNRRELVFDEGIEQVDFGTLLNPPIILELFRY